MDLEINYFKVKLTQIEMLNLRGYNISQQEREFYNNVINMTDENKIKYFKSIDNIKNFNRFYINNNNENIYVYYHKITEKKISADEMRDFVAEYLTNSFQFIDDYNNFHSFKMDKVILIINNELSSKAKKILEPIINNVEIFYHKDLYYNLTKHILYSPHTMLSNIELTDLLSDLKSDIFNLPILLKTDPVTKFLGFKKGQVIRIYRNNLFLDSINSRSIYYRIVS